MGKSLKSTNKTELEFLDINKDHYIRIPKKFTKKIQLGDERKIILKSNDNVWFFEIRDKNIEKDIVEQTTVSIDKKWGFVVPLMNYELELDPEIENFVFFDDENGIGFGHTESYAVWSYGKLNREINGNINFKTMEEMNDFIMKSIREDKEEDSKE